MSASPESKDDTDSTTSEGPSGECEDDRCAGPVPPIWHCVDCDSSYCSDCWSRQGPHRPNKKGRDGVPHEKTNPHVVRRLRTILNPPRNQSEIQRLHEEDESTKWFGVARDSYGRPTFEDYGRYSSLMANISPADNFTNRYPQLVSFIGVTNAGKSTLIKMLVEHDPNNLGIDRTRFASPVVGSVVNDSLPTSGDVHLYADPATHAEQLPILYADCEGFEGGERIPLGARTRRGLRSDPDNEDPERPSNVIYREIQWANSEESRQREFTVTALYPRLLYTFSDCVVFVLRNPKTFQSAVLTKLIEWGVAALEKSINQPALPHCVVALNGTDPSVDEEEWDVNFATQSLLFSVKTALDTVEGVPRFRELAEYWRSLGEPIYTIEDLILRYYSSFKVIRIPAKPRYMLINEQIVRLHQLIRSNCEESFKAKRRARMLTNADELNVYLQSGFDHFTTHLNTPFNFMEISLLRNPIPNDFGGHILQLCTTIAAKQPNHQPGRVAWMFEKLSVMLASCVLLDCARYRKGRVDTLFSNYEKFFNYAMGEYLELHTPCSYVSADGTRQCMLVKARHQPKGHQDAQGIIAAGDYMTAFDMNFVQNWKSQLRTAIECVHRDFTYELEQLTQIEDTQVLPEERIALDLHAEYLNHFFDAVGPASSIFSHATCFCCLMDVPEHPLPCGHVLCTACIKAYGKSNKSSLAVQCCPLHRDATNWETPAQIKFKPPGAGVTILSLDGGGIRGIVQLEVLRAIEQTLGGYLPVQMFFDLIVGTGTGGLLAVALAMKDRTVDSCIDMFRALCDHAFTPRLKGVPVISTLVQVFGNGPRYKTKPLYSALRTAFGEDEPLFGRSTRLRNGARIALTTSSVTGRETMLLANYRRPDDYLPAYLFERPHEPEMELNIWEAVAAALANPSFFRPFNFHGKTYLDGGLRGTNPSFLADHERRLIWPEVNDPDLFLSLGTGQNRITVLQKLSERSKEHARAHAPQMGRNGDEARKTPSKWRTRKLDDVIDAEVAWADFRDFAIRDRSEAKGRRFIRFNPDLDKEPPSPDSKGDIEALHVNVRKKLQTPHRIAALRNVAHRLLASSFHFELQSRVIGEKGEQVCVGNITCRYEDGSRELSALGKILEDRRGEEFEPFFLVMPDREHKNYAFRVPVTVDVIRGMTDSGVFGPPTVYLPLRDETKASSVNLFLSAHDGLEPDGFPISGFPRVLLGEPSGGQRRPATRGNSEELLRSSSQYMRKHSEITSASMYSKGQSDGDSISLNGHGASATGTSSSEEVWPEAPPRPSDVSVRTPKLSLAEIIAQQRQNSGSSIKGKTNRFWTYIGNAHMAQHPEMYSPDELAKFASAQPPEFFMAAQAEYPAPTLTIPSPASPLLPLSPSLTQKTQDYSPRSPGSFVSAQSAKTVESPNFGLSIDVRPQRSQSSVGELPDCLKIGSSNSQSPASPNFNIRPASKVQRHSMRRRGTYPNHTPSLAEAEYDEYSDSDYSMQEPIRGASPLAQMLPYYPVRTNSAPAPRSSLDNYIEEALPKENEVLALSRWLAAQRSTGTLQRKAGKLRVVDESFNEDDLL